MAVRTSAVVAAAAVLSSQTVAAKEASWPVAMAAVIVRMESAWPRSDDFSRFMAGVAAVRPGPAQCATAVTILPSQPVRASVVGFLDEPPCQSPAPLMLMQLDLEASTRLVNELRTELAAALGAPCSGVKADPEPTGLAISVWVRPHTLVALVVAPGDADGATLTVLATGLQPHTPAARERYQAVLAASRQALPAACR